MDLGLEGKTALITGSSRGIGKATALCLAQEGANVIICGRNYDELLALEDKIVGEHNVVVGSYKVDATDPESIEEMFKGVERDIGNIDILVNNVGGAEKFGSFFNLTDEDWLKAYELNFMSVVRFSRKVIPWLKRSGQGRIINIASLSAVQSGRYNQHYSSAKAAVLNLTKSLADMLAPDNILVYAICPSTLRGGGWEKNVQDRASRDGISTKDAEELMLAEEQTKTPLGRIGTPEDVANLVAFLASDKNNYMTGSCLYVDGGIRRTI